MNPAMRIVILGSGGAPVEPDRGGPGVLVMVDDDLLLFNCGRDTSTKIIRANRRLSSVGRLFLSNCALYEYSCDLATFAISGWMDGRSERIKVAGPPGTGEFIRKLFEEAFIDDLTARKASPRPREGMEFECRELEDGDSVTKKDCWTVTAREVGSRIFPRMAYRITSYEGRSVVLTGNCAPNEKLPELARGADVLILGLEGLGGGTDTGYAGIKPAGISEVAAESGAGRIILDHLEPYMDIDDIRFRIERVYDGDVDMATDLMQITV